MCDVEVQMKQLRLRVHLKKGQLDNPKGFFRVISEIVHYGVGDYEAVVNAETDLDWLIHTDR